MTIIGTDSTTYTLYVDININKVDTWEFEYRGMNINIIYNLLDMMSESFKYSKIYSGENAYICAIYSSSKINSKRLIKKIIQKCNK